MSRELLDKILEGEFKEANDAYGSVMAEKALDSMNAHEFLTHFDGDFSILEDEDIKELLDDILFHIQESISENPEYTRDDICDDWIEDIIAESYIRGFLDDTIVLNESDEFQLNENVDNVLESKIIKSVLQESGLIKRVRSAFGRKIRKAKKKCPGMQVRQGTKCVSVSARVKQVRKKAGRKIKRAWRKTRANLGKMRKRLKILRKTKKIKKQLTGLKR